MTRELKFRVWDEYALLFCCPLTIFDKISKTDEEHMTLGDDYYHDRWIIEQYTGLKDKNGKEIYEGDIIEVETCVDEEEKTTYEVYWDEDTLEYALKVIKGVNYDSCVGELSQSATEVIGNIHEDLEL